MPFESKSQWRKCWAMNRRGGAGSWDCKEWADSTKKPFKKLPESKPMTEKEAFDNMVRVKTALYKLQSIFEKAAMEPVEDVYRPPATGPQPKLMHGPSNHPEVLRTQQAARASRAGRQAGLTANSINARNLQQSIAPPAGMGMVPHEQRTYPVGITGR